MPLGYQSSGYKSPVGAKSGAGNTGAFVGYGGGYNKGQPQNAAPVDPWAANLIARQKRKKSKSALAPRPAPSPAPRPSSATPYGSAGGSADTLADFGTGLLDPGSGMSKRWMEQLREGIGKSTDANQRAAGYQAAQQGFGAGASPEMLEMQQMLGVAGQEAEGQAASDFMLQAPGLGVNALGGAMGAQVGMRGQDLQSSMAEMSNYLSREQSNASLEMQQRNLALERERMEQDRYLRELMLEYGGY